MKPVILLRYGTLFVHQATIWYPKIFEGMFTRAVTKRFVFDESCRLPATGKCRRLDVGASGDEDEKRLCKFGATCCSDFQWERRR